jgi:hypothetical protein
MEMWVAYLRQCKGMACKERAHMAVLCLCCRFAEYRKDDPASFLLHQNLSYFPHFMFNMRRSPFVQVRTYARP